MNDLRVLLTQTRYSLTSTLRTSRAVVFGIVFPVFLLVLFNSAFTSGADSTIEFAGGTMSTKAYFTAGMAAYAITMQSFSFLMISITDQRESGQLKRLRGTPMRTWTFIGALLLRALILSVVMVVIMFAVGVLAYGLDLTPGGVVGIAVYTVLGTAALSILGIAATTLARTPEAAATIGPFSAVILSFISGIFIPINTLPEWLRAVGRVFPLYHLAEGLQRSTAATSGTGLNGADVLVLLVWTAVGLQVAVRRMRWEPQAARA
ncbi:ABC transporter permease [Kitasatospora sp. NPDC050543]|uniref:ABC transporter permease n=1 Tax=Kitasatospora sp. NPDC050543 TaxID=3364054 RepID=UPI00378B936D